MHFFPGTKMRVNRCSIIMCVLIISLSYIHWLLGMLFDCHIASKKIPKYLLFHGFWFKGHTTYWIWLGIRIAVITRTAAGINRGRFFFEEICYVYSKKRSQSIGCRNLHNQQCTKSKLAWTAWWPKKSFLIILCYFQLLCMHKTNSFPF